MSAASTGHPSIAGTSESFFGNLEFVQDVLLVVEACRQGLLPRSVRRLRDGDRSSAIRPGSVFVWRSNEAGMRRWTDGKSWSPSRSHGSFLIYRECLPKDQLAAMASASNNASEAASASPSVSTPESAAQPQQRQTTPSQTSVTDLGNGLQIKHGHRGDYCPLPNGLVKRTISVPVAADGATYNVVNYVHCDDASNAGLAMPSTDRWLCELGITAERMPWTLYPSIVNSILLNKATGANLTPSSGDRRGNAAGSLPSASVAAQLESGLSHLQHQHPVSRPRGSSFNMYQRPMHQSTSVTTGSFSSSHSNGHASEPTPWPTVTHTLPHYSPHSTPSHAPPAQHLPPLTYHQPPPLMPQTYPNTILPYLPGPSNFASPVPSPTPHAESTSPLLLSSSAPNLSPISLVSRQRSSTGSSTSSLVMREAWASVQRPAPYPSPRGSCPVSPVRSSDAVARQLELAPILAPIASTRTSGMGDDFEAGGRLGGLAPVYVEPGWATTSASGAGYRVGGVLPVSDGSGASAFRPFPPPV